MSKHKIVGQDGKPSNHGTDATPDRGRKFGTKVQETPMSGTETGNRFGIRSGRVPNIEDSINEGKRK